MKLHIYEIHFNTKSGGGLAWVAAVSNIQALRLWLSQDEADIWQFDESDFVKKIYPQRMKQITIECEEGRRNLLDIVRETTKPVVLGSTCYLI